MRHPHTGDRVYRHSVSARIAHWTWALAILVLVMSGLQIFNASPDLDASDKSSAAHRVLEIGGRPEANGAMSGFTTVFGHEFRTTHVLGYTADGEGGESLRAFPSWVTLPGYQSLADGRRWHILFAWCLVFAMGLYLVSALFRGSLRELVLRPSDLPKLWPMQAYYLHLRPEPPPHGTYNPLQKLAYTGILFVVFPLVVLTGLALSPGVDTAAPWLTWIFGGRQFARLWHFTLMALLVFYTCGHIALVALTGAWNNTRSMLTGRYVLGPHDGVGP